MNTLRAVMALRGLELHLHFGWPEAERVQKQCVLLDFNLQFSKAPRACETDQLEDTFCYDNLTKIIQNHVATHQFRLLEHLGHSLYELIKSQVSSAFVKIAVTKKTDIPYLTQGVTFHYGDEECAW